MNALRTAAATLAVLATAALPAVAQTSSPAPASDAMAMHARFSKAPVYTGAPNLPLTLSMVVAGGGPADFRSTKLLGVLAGSLTDAELKSLTAKFGADNVTAFAKTFDFVVSDALRLANEHNVALPASPNPSPSDGKALAAALYKQGITPAGAFDVEYMLDGLVSHPIHVQIMDDIDKDPAQGPAVDGNYHAVLTQAMLDLKAAYKL